MQVFFPSPSLQPFVKRYVLISTGDGTISNTLLPDTSITLAFRLRGATSYVNEQETKLPSSVITGLRTGPRTVKYEANSSCIIVVFQTLASGNFFTGQPHEFFNDSIALKDVLNHTSISVTEERLQATDDATSAVTIIEEFLRSNLTPSSPDKLVYEAVRLLTTSGGQIKMRDLADHLCISQDAFEKRFRKVAGSSPKHFARTIRLRAIVNQKQNTTPITTLALQAGYFDSAHFNKAFKSFTGQSPSEFFKKPIFW